MDLDDLLVCMQSSLSQSESRGCKCQTLSHHAAWSGSFQNASVFPGCLSLGLMSTGSLLCIYAAMLTAGKPHLECGLDVRTALWM